MWLAVASVLVVLVASGVAVSRIADRDGDRRVAGDTASGGGPAAAAVGTAAVAASAPAPATASATAPATATRMAAGHSGRTGSGRPTGAATGTPKRSAAETGPAGGTPSREGGSQSGGSTAADRAGGQPDGRSGGPPPSGEAPPQEMHLVGASVSAGQGAAGGVVGVTAGGATPGADVTIGSNPVVGHHPPANGTGIAFSGRFFHPPPSVPVLPG